MKRSKSRAVIAGLGLALVAAPAQADGTVRYNFPEECFSYHDNDLGDTTFCSSSSGQFNYTVTPSGIESYQGEGTSSFTVTNEYDSFTDTYHYRTHVLTKQGALQVFREKFSDSYILNGESCTATTTLMFSNGEARQERATNDCS